MAINLIYKQKEKNKSLLLLNACQYLEDNRGKTHNDSSNIRVRLKKIEPKVRIYGDYFDKALFTRPINEKLYKDSVFVITIKQFDFNDFDYEQLTDESYLVDLNDVKISNHESNSQFFTDEETEVLVTTDGFELDKERLFQ